MLGALVLAPVLLLTDIWSSPQLNIVHRHPLEAVVGAAVVVAALIAAAAVIARRPWLVAPLAVFALPFRVPISTGGGTANGGTSNLLVPLYFVIAAAALAWIYHAWRAPSEPPAEPGPPPATAHEPTVHARARDGLVEWVVRLLALYVVLYGDPGLVFGQLRAGAPEHGLLLRAVRAAAVPAARAGVGSPAHPRLPAGDGRAGARLLAHRLLRVRHQDDHPQLQAGHRQRPAHLLHRQLGVPGPRHLRALPGAGDHPARGRAHLRLPAARPGDASPSCSPCSGRACS